MVAVTVVAANGMNRATGYGKLEAGLVQGFEQIGADVQKVMLSRLDPDPERTLARGLAAGRADLTVFTGSPSWGELLDGRTRAWLYTMSETNRVSEEWVDTINHCFEGVFVPCPPLVDVYRESGVRVPVVFAPMGVEVPKEVLSAEKRQRSSELRDKDKGTAVLTQNSELRTQNFPFTFLTYSLGDMRKGAELAMFAFNRLFGRDPAYRLIIKARDNARLSWLAGLDESNMSVVGGETSEADWWSLLARADCFVFPSRGEGFGLPPREATLAGVPAIATQWLGLWDVDCWGLPVGVSDLRPASFDEWGANAEGSLWAEPDQDDLDDAMRFTVDCPQDAQRYAQKGREYLEYLFNWRRTAAVMMEVLNG